MGLRLFFLPNFPGATFIPDLSTRPKPAQISDSVSKNGHTAGLYQKDFGCVPPPLSLRPGSREGAIKNLQLPIVVKVPKKHIMMIEVYKFTASRGRSWT